jgi:hypothetical protein
MVAVTATAGLAGLALGKRLPAHHLDQESRDAVRLVASFLAALSALVLGLLIAAAKDNYEERNGQLHRIAADVVSLDRALARFGQGAEDARALLHAVMADEYARYSEGGQLRGAALEQANRDGRLPEFYDRVQTLAPHTDVQRAARDRAAQLIESIATLRVLLTQDLGGSIPVVFLLVLGFWMAIIFASFGLFVRANATVIAALLAGAASVGAAVFLILELDRPLTGLMRLSTEPLRHAVEMIQH